MGFFKPTAFFTGVAKEGLTMFDKAESISEEGIANLKIAREEVNEEIAEVKDKHNKAMQIGDNVGGGAFAQFLVKQRGLDYMAGLNNLSESDLNTELSSLKSKFNALDDSQKAELTEGGFSEAVTSSYDKEVDALKVKKGLVNNNNMGEATANTLTGKVQQMVDRQAQPRRDDIISTVDGGKLRESDPIEGGFDSITQISSIKPFLSLNYQDAAKYNKDYLSWFKDNYRDAMTGEIRDPQAVQDRLVDSLVRAGYTEIMSPDDPSRLDDKENENGLTKLDVILEGIASQENTTRQGAVEEIIRESYFDQFFGKGSYGDGYLSIKRNNVAVEQGQTNQIPLTVAEDFKDMSLEDQIAETRRVLINDYGTEASEQLSDEEIIQIINNNPSLS